MSRAPKAAKEQRSQQENASRWRIESDVKMQALSETMHDLASSVYHDGHRLAMAQLCFTINKPPHSILAFCQTSFVHASPEYNSPLQFSSQIR
jgi:hypothetical protein